ncbi:MAG: HD domain-containing protein [Anaerolineae bacterium]|nr:HD domain-containing protein [Anaerolineae bacterium]
MAAIYARKGREAVISVEEARQHYQGSDAIHDFDHVQRVLALAERLAKAEGADLEIVRTAGLLHDMARGQEGDPPADHAQLGAEMARRLLVGHPVEKVEAVAHAIAAHRFRTGPQPETLEARVLHDADKLDAIGAIGVARAFAYGGHVGQRLWAEVSADYREGPATAGEHTPVHEYEIKLVQIRERLLTQSARHIAEERHAFMVDFFKRLEREVRGLD